MSDREREGRPEPARRTSRRRLIALVQKGAGIAPNQRFRIEQWAPWLAREHGIDVELRPFESEELSRILYESGSFARKARAVLRGASRLWADRHELLEADAVLVVREASLVGGAWMERWLAAQGVPYVYDFDDAIWTVSRSASNGLMSLARAPWKVGRICSMAGSVTVGNEYLADYARAHTHSVHIVRTSIDTDRFPQLPARPPDGRFVIVWTGSHSTLAHLETLRPVLERLGRVLPLTLRVVCDRPPDRYENLVLDFVPWRAESEAAELAVGDVGVMPLPDTDFARGKCGCKALQYMAIGRPAVVAPVGINTEIVRHGENGLVASDEQGWYDAILGLARDPRWRAALGARARATVLQGFTAERSAAAFAGAVDDAMSRDRRRRDEHRGDEHRGDARRGDARA